MKAEADCAIRAEHLSDRMNLNVWAEQALVDLLEKDSLAQVWLGMEAWRTLFQGPFAGHSLVLRGLQQHGGPRHTGKEVEKSAEEVAASARPMRGLPVALTRALSMPSP